jgi:hypothetical protein
MRSTAAEARRTPLIRFVPGGGKHDCRRCQDIPTTIAAVSVYSWKNTILPWLYLQTWTQSILDGFARSLGSTGRRADNHDGVALLDHFTRRKLGKIHVRSYPRTIPVVIGSSVLSIVISFHVMFGPMPKPRAPTTSITNVT